MTGAQGHELPRYLPAVSFFRQKVDWEAELAIVIGKKCKALNKDEGEDCIFGYTVAQDITARDWQKGKRNGGQFLLGKAMDTFCPLGPAIVTKESVCDINNLSVRTWVNGNIKQDGNTSELIFKPIEIVAYISQYADARILEHSCIIRISKDSIS